MGCCDIISKKVIVLPASVGLVLAEGIAYDWIAENIYFTDSNLTHIGVCDRNGKFCTVVVQEALDKPREIVLHPKTGYDHLFQSLCLSNAS